MVHVMLEINGPDEDGPELMIRDQLLGVIGFGDTPQEALANWADEFVRSAQELINTDSAGFSGARRLQRALAMEIFGVDK